MALGLASRSATCCLQCDALIQVPDLKGMRRKKVPISDATRSLFPRDTHFSVPAAVLDLDVQLELTSRCAAGAAS
eukprot:4398582-Pleurochrysis_carterae.AAC.1